jgi:hypothetical protein
LWGSPVGTQLGSHSCPLLCRVSKGRDRKAGWQPENMTPGQAGVLKGSGVELAESLSMTSWISLYSTLRFAFRFLFLFFFFFFSVLLSDSSCLYLHLTVSVAICHCVSLSWDSAHTCLGLGLVCSLLSLLTILGTRPKGPLRMESAVPEGRV